MWPVSERNGLFILRQQDGGGNGQLPAVHLCDAQEASSGLRRAVVCRIRGGRKAG